MTKEEYVERIKQVIKSDFMAFVDDKQIDAIANKIADYKVEDGVYTISEVVEMYFSEVLGIEYRDIAYSDNVSDLEIPYSTLYGTPVDE